MRLSSLNPNTGGGGGGGGRVNMAYTEKDYLKWSIFRVFLEFLLKPVYFGEVLALTLYCLVLK